MQKVLIAEDDLMIADMSEEALLAYGYEVCGIGRTVDQAVALGRRHHPDLAIIDLRMAEGGIGTEVAARLSDIPRLGILYVTGSVGLLVPHHASGHACLAKPYRFVDLIRALEIVTELVRTGTASQPFPAGFHTLPLARSNPRGTARDGQMETAHAG
jgi:CheY-like chemotaxis protein